MQDYMIERVLEEGEYIARTGNTVRETAKKFNSSKSTVHKDVTLRLKEIDYQLFLAVKKRLNINLLERHLRGGVATKIKYQKINSGD